MNRYCVREKHRLTFLCRVQRPAISCHTWPHNFPPRSDPLPPHLHSVDTPRYRCYCSTLPAHKLLPNVFTDLKSSLQWLWRVLFSWTWQFAAWWKYTDVSKESVDSVFRDDEKLSKRRIRSKRRPGIWSILAHWYLKTVVSEFYTMAAPQLKKFITPNFLTLRAYRHTFFQFTNF